MKLFECQACGQLLYFENTRCESCGRRLGFLSWTQDVTALEPEGEAWKALAEPDGSFRFCANAEHDACNWLIPADSPDAYCMACRHNRIIPDLSLPENIGRWRRLEKAKHRLFYSLQKLRLPVATRAEHPRGLDLRVSCRPGRAGAARPARHDRPRQRPDHHQHRRSRRRGTRAAPPRHGRALSHPARPFPPRDRPLLLGCPHRATTAASPVSGRSSATSARTTAPPSQRHYANGPPGDWQNDFVSSYASAHPWEDWAETWAHYLHIVDTLETASAFGLRSGPHQRWPGAVRRHRVRPACRARPQPPDRRLAAPDLRGEFPQPQHGAAGPLSLRPRPERDRQAPFRARTHPA